MTTPTRFAEPELYPDLDISLAPGAWIREMPEEISEAYYIQRSEWTRQACHLLYPETHLQRDRLPATMILNLFLFFTVKCLHVSVRNAWSYSLVRMLRMQWLSYKPDQCMWRQRR
jgi:hypothetical protein